MITGAVSKTGGDVAGAGVVTTGGVYAGVDFLSELKIVIKKITAITLTTHQKPFPLLV